MTAAEEVWLSFHGATLTFRASGAVVVDFRRTSTGDRVSATGLTLREALAAAREADDARARRAS